jgi:hypothetical protein
MENTIKIELSYTFREGSICMVGGRVGLEVSKFQTANIIKISPPHLMC